MLHDNYWVSNQWTNITFLFNITDCVCFAISLVVVINLKIYEIDSVFFYF